MVKIYRLIIVDDELMARESLKRYIAEKCVDFEVAGLFKNGQEAIDFIDQNKIDVVFTDVRMPKLDGMELAKYINENRPEIKVVIVSGYSEFDYAQKAIKYNVQDYLLKMFEPMELFNTLDKIKETLDAERKNELKDINFDIEIYLHDLLCGFFTSYEMAVKSYHELNFDVQFDSCICEVIDIVCEDFNDFIKNTWKHEEEGIVKAILNFAKFVFKDVLVFSAEIEDGTCKIIIFHVFGYRQLPVNALITALKDELGLKSYINSNNQYTLTEVYNGDYDKYGKHFESDNFAAKESDEDMEQNTTINHIISFVNENYDKEIGRAEIAKHFHMNAQYLGRIFKKETNKTLMEYIMEVRLEKAIKMLYKGYKTDEILEHTGYVDRRTFQRAFKRYTGLSISEYRKTHIWGEG